MSSRGRHKVLAARRRRRALRLKRTITWTVLSVEAIRRDAAAIVEFVRSEVES